MIKSSNKRVTLPVSPPSKVTEDVGDVNLGRM